MKKRMIIIAASVIFVVLCFYRFWPCSFSSLLSVDVENTGMFIYSITNESTGDEETYTIEGLDETMESKHLKEIMNIIESSNYQKDFRNVYLRNSNEFINLKKYSGTKIELLIYPREWVSEGKGFSEHFTIGFWDFGGKCIVSIDPMEATGFRIYHSTNKEMMNDLLEYIKENGEKR